MTELRLSNHALTRCLGLALTCALACSDAEPAPTQDAESEHEADASHAGPPTASDASVRRDSEAAKDARVEQRDGAPTVPPGPSGVDIIKRLPAASATTAFYLSETGLYDDIAEKRLAGDIVEYAPNYALWSDGATKRRFLKFPDGASIDSADMDSWMFPVGTLAFKEFSRDGVRIETRLVARTGPGERDYWMGAFLWDADEKDAVFVPNGQDNASGTTHDVPKAKQCGTCHDGERGRFLGLSAVQLAGAEPLDLAQVVSRGWLSAPPARVDDYGPVADAQAAAALGYLHANCGSCHNPSGSARPDTDLVLRLSAGVRELEATPTYKTSVGVGLQNFFIPIKQARISAGDPDSSWVVMRMKERGSMRQMPPLASEQVDADGVQVVSQWIRGL